MGAAQTSVSVASSSILPGSVQERIITTLSISPHLTDHSKNDLRLCYAKYLAIHNTIDTLSKMYANSSWAGKVPTNDKVIKVFMTRSYYFRSPHKIFPLVPKHPAMEGWLLGCGDVGDVWGGCKQTIESLGQILQAHVSATSHASSHASAGSASGEKKVKKGKGKESEVEDRPRKSKSDRKSRT